MKICKEYLINISDINSIQVVENKNGARFPSILTPGVDRSARILKWGKTLHKNVRSRDWKDIGSVASIGEDTIRIMGRQHRQYDVPKSLIEGFNGSEVILQISKREMYNYEVTNIRKYLGHNVDLELLLRKIQDYLRQKGFAVTKVSSDRINSELAFHIEAEAFSSLKNSMLGKRSVDIIIKGTPNNFGVTFTTEWEENDLGFGLSVSSLATSAIHSMISSAFSIGAGIEKPTVFLSQKILERDLRNDIGEEIDRLKNSAHHNTAS
jgi:hypothetical protein